MSASPDTDPHGSWLVVDIDDDAGITSATGPVVSRHPHLHHALAALPGPHKRAVIHISDRAVYKVLVGFDASLRPRVWGFGLTVDDAIVSARLSGCPDANNCVVTSVGIDDLNFDPRRLQPPPSTLEAYGLKLAIASPTGFVPLERP